MNRWSFLLWPAIIILSAIAVTVANFGILGPALRPIIVLWFLLVCPGMAFIRLLRLREVAVEWMLAIALSIAVDAIVAGLLLYAGKWSPPVILVILIDLSLVGAFFQLVFPPSPTPPAREQAQTDLANYD